jgi:hypothetical protein
MSWLSSAWTRNRGAIGNALKNFAPVAGALTGGLGGLAIGGLGSALGRGIQPGAKFGDIAKQGISGGSIAYSGSKALGGLKGLFAPGSSAAGTAAGSVAGTPPLPPGAEELASLGGGDIASAQPLLSKIGHAASSVGSFANKNPMAAAMALQGVGSAMNAPSEGRYRDAQTRALEAQVAESEEERARRKRLEDAMEPLRQMLVAQMNQPRMGIAPNPYRA